MTEYRVVKRFNTWTDILNFLLYTKDDFEKTETRYKTEVYYDDEADLYKVYIIV